MSNQLVVVYDVPGDLDRVYSTGYNELQAQHAFMRCLERYGRRANIRTMEAKRRYAKGRR